MARTGSVINKTRGRQLLDHVQWCSSFACKLRGLMFRRALPAGSGLLLVEGQSSRANTAVHMMFMSFPIAVIWLDDDFRVVDKRYAAPWRPFYVPSQPARYTLEANAELLECVEVGDELVWQASDGQG